MVVRKKFTIGCRVRLATYPRKEGVIVERRLKGFMVQWDHETTHSFHDIYELEQA